MYALNNIHTIKSTHKTCVETNCIIKHNATGIGLYGIDEISWCNSTKFKIFENPIPSQESGFFMPYCQRTIGKSLKKMDMWSERRKHKFAKLERYSLHRGFDSLHVLHILGKLKWYKRRFVKPRIDGFESLSQSSIWIQRYSSYFWNIISFKRWCSSEAEHSTVNRNVEISKFSTSAKQL